MGHRLEKDTMGEIAVPTERYWGAQTQRSLENFPIGHERMPFEVIIALVHVKKAAAIVNANLGILDSEHKELIVRAADWVLTREPYDEFPLKVWQTGSGTQTNMNVNEVLANYANELVGQSKGTKIPVHPNDHVNKSQSSNDVFPTASHLAIIIAMEKHFHPAMEKFLGLLEKKAKDFSAIVKIGRTHLMDATPITFGQEFSGYVEQVRAALKNIEQIMPQIREIALGGTAVGTGLNAPYKFGKKVASELSRLLQTEIVSAPNKFQAISSIDAQVALSGALRTLAVALMKIANDIRLSGSGPRCGIGELQLPENEPGSSIMPGKVNPTQPEALTQIAAQVMGNDLAISIGGANSHFQLNVFRPMAIFNLLQSIHLLADGCATFAVKCLEGLQPNIDRVRHHLENSLMLVTALNPHIGYDNAAKVAKYAHVHGVTLKEAVLALNLLSSEDFDRLVDPIKMLG